MIARRVKQFLQQEKGASALYFALVLFILLGMAGIALDGSNSYAQRRRMQTAADAAALAGARVLALGGDTNAVNEAVINLAMANGVGDIPWTLSGDGKAIEATGPGAPDVAWNYTDDNTGVEVTVNNNFDTYFARVLGFDELTSNGDSGARYEPIVGVDNLLPLAVNGCDCLNFDEFPVSLSEDDFGDIVTAIYQIGNANDASIDYTIYLKNLDPTYPGNSANRPYYMFYTVGNDGIFTEYGEGTARSLHVIANVNGDGFIVDMRYSDRTTTPPNGDSPACEGACPNTTDWHYYATTEGTLNGLPGTRYEGAVIEVNGRGAAMQVGTNAHLKNPQPQYGAAAGLTLDVLQQPTTGVVLTTHSEEAANNMILLPVDAESDSPTATPTEETPAPTATFTPVPPTPTATNTFTPAPPTATPTPSTATVIKLNDDKDSTYTVELISQVGTTWTYRVTEVKGRDLSHWNLGIASCLDNIVSYNPTSGYENGTDGSTGFVGVKWNTGGGFTSGDFSITLDNSYPTTTVQALVKAGSTSNTGAVLGPDCTTAPTPTATTAVAGGACFVTYKINNDWGSGFVAEVAIKNQTGAALNGWTLTWTFPGNQQITNLWNGTLTQAGANVQVKNASWNGNVSNGSTISFGFQGTYSGTNTKPTSFALNGATCNVSLASLTPANAVALSSAPDAAASALSTDNLSLSPLSIAAQTVSLSSLNFPAVQRVSVGASPLSVAGLTVPSLAAAPLSFSSVANAPRNAPQLVVPSMQRTALLAAVPEVEFCTYNLRVKVGETFHIRDYIVYKDNDFSHLPVDWGQVSFTYTDAGANNPTNPPDWHLSDFNNGISVTAQSADRANGTGNQGKGKYRIYIVRNGQATYDDHMTIVVNTSQSDVNSAKCAPSSVPTLTPTPTNTPTSVLVPTATPPFSQYCTDNLLLNPSFELGTANWTGITGTGNHGYVIPDGTKYGYHAGSINAKMYQDVPVVPGGSYSMSFFSASHIPGYQTVAIEYLTAANATVGTPAVHTITVDIDDPGNVFGGPYTLSLGAAPANAAKLRVTVKANNVDWAKVDALCLQGITPVVTLTPTPTSTPAPATPTPTSTSVPPTATPTATSTLAPTLIATPAVVTCDLYPIALNTQTLVGATPGVTLGDIWNGVQPGNFGWLTWVGAPNVPTLATSLTPPGDSDTYVNPYDASDYWVTIGDWVQGSPGVSNASSVRSALDILKTIDIVVPVWDQATGNGNNSLYRVANFAVVRITDYALPNQNRITATFLGYAPQCSISPTPTPTSTATATPTASSSPTATPTATATPTVTETPTPVPPTPTSVPVTPPPVTPPPPSGSCVLDDVAGVMNRYTLIVLDDLSTSSDIENRAFVGGSLVSSTSASIGINVSGIAPTEAMFVVVGDLVAGNPLNLNAGSLRLGGNRNNRPINFNGGGSLIQDSSLSDGPVTALAQDASAQLAAEVANNGVTLPSGQPGPAKFQVTNTTPDGVAIFQVAGADLFGNNAVQQIELNPGSASLVVINVTGSTVNWSGNGNMVGNFNNSQWRSRVIWNFPQATSINMGSHNMMGAVLAPYAAVTTAGNIDGSALVRSLTTSAEIHQPTFGGDLGALCEDEEDPTNPPPGGTACKLAWMDWDGGIASNAEIVNYLNNPSQSGVWRVGDTVPAGPDVEQVAQIAAALNQWLNKPMKIALYDDGNQQNGYEICGFAEFTMTDYDFSSLPKWIQGEFNLSVVRGETDPEAEDYGMRGIRFK